MLSDQLTDYAAAALEARRALLSPIADRVDAALTAAAKDRDAAVLTAYLYGTLPLADCFDVPAGVLASHVGHALYLRRTLPWTQELPEGIFVHHVLCPRVNNEPVQDCRRVFFEALAPRVAGLSVSEAVREVNYWCAEAASYEASDGRTLGPLAVLSSGSGRCGEESTLLVTALRSVGIPARQVYAPWWAHCDDNHAWVEAYVDGAWHYLGACEPEEELDRGWFTNAAGRALLAETRLYSGFADPADPADTGKGSARCGGERIVNVTASYAPTRALEVRVGDACGGPVRDAVVTLEVLNMACWMPAATLATDKDGLARLDVGLGTLRVRASDGERAAEATLDTRDQGAVALVLSPVDGTDHGWANLDVRAPEDRGAPSSPLTREQEDRGRAHKSACDELRRKRLEGMRRHAAELAQRWPGSERAFSLAFGNADELAAFLSGDDGADRLALLSTLSDKDFRDVSADLLEAHLAHARPRREKALTRLRSQGLSPKDADEVYLRFIACPRIRLEELSAYRDAVGQALGPELGASFAKDPRALWAWLCRELSYDAGEGLGRLVGSPAGALASRQASPATRAHEFVAACRTLGTAARLIPATGRPEFMEGGRFVPVEGLPATTPVTLVCPKNTEPAYFSAWSLGRLERRPAADGRAALAYSTLDLEGARFEGGRLGLCLAPGTYRLVSSARLPNGGQLASERVFSVGTDPIELELRVRVPDPAELVNVTPLPPLPGALAPATGAHSLGVLAFVERGAEPTEHLVNELAARARELGEADLPVTLVPAADAPAGLVEKLARRTYVNPDALPLTLLVRRDGADDGALTSLFAAAGYNVGTVDLLLSLPR